MKKIHILNLVLMPVLLLATDIVVGTLWAIPSVYASSLAAQSDGAAPASINTNMQGRVEKAELKEDESIKLSLKSVSDSLRRLQETLQGIVYEITRQQQVPVMQPNIVGSMVIPNIPAMQVPIGDYLPPRQKYIRTFAQQVQTLLPTLIEQASTLPADDAFDDDLNSQMTLIKNDLQYLQEQNLTLQGLMAAPPYQNLAIGRVVIRMSDKLDEIKKLLKKSERRVSKDIKHDPK